MTTTNELNDFIQFAAKHGVTGLSEVFEKHNVTSIADLQREIDADEAALTDYESIDRMGGAPDQYPNLPFHDL